MKNYFKIGIALTAGWVLNKVLAARRISENIEVNIARVDIKGTILDPKFIIYINITNHSDEAIKINQVYGDVLLAGTDIILANIVADNIQIKARSVVQLPINLQTRIERVVKIVYEFFIAKKLTVRFIGGVNFGGVHLPIDTTYKVV